MKAYVYKSSGIEGFDDAALGAAEASTYEPAMFFCTPVVGEYFFNFGYRP